MPTQSVSKLRRVDPRELWKYEATGFTRWLQENMDVLSAAIDFEITNPDREQAAGAFNADLIAQDTDGQRVVIENQLEKSDHDHLGKLITYVTAFEAKIGIWIVTEPRNEHVRAIAWLNEASSVDFFLLKLEAVCIDDSAPAPLLTVIVGPSAEAEEVGRTKQELSEQQDLRFRFFQELLARAKKETLLHAGVSPSGRNHWVGTGAGRSGLALNYVVRKIDCNVELYIDLGADSADQTKNVFDQLANHKEEIERAFGGELTWQRLDGKRACRIRRDYEIGGYTNEGKWSEIQDSLIDGMVRLHRALQAHLEKIEL